MIIVDNDSSYSTKKLLLRLFNKKFFNKLIYNEKNVFFAAGNNIAFKYCAPESKYILLLNSDVEIRDPYWLKKLLSHHAQGAVSYGACLSAPIRCDGYCLLLDKDLYLKYQLDEKYSWWWSVTKLQAQMLNDNYAVTAIKDHEKFLHHFGGKSGTGWKNAKKTSIVKTEIIDWFGTKSITVIDSID